MVTAQQVFDIALVLMDEVTDTGQILADNPNYYAAKAKSALTMLQAELTKNPSVITDLSQELQVSARLALTALP